MEVINRSLNEALELALTAWQDDIHDNIRTKMANPWLTFSLASSSDPAAPAGSLSRPPPLPDPPDPFQFPPLPPSRNSPLKPPRPLPSLSLLPLPPPLTPSPANPIANDWASKVKKTIDRSLSRLSPVSLSPEGVPRVIIPEEVYEQGAELHRDFVVCRFFGRLPAYTLIQNVLNYMWGKGKHLEIHMSPATNSVLVRLPNEFIRQKITQKAFWYVDTTMFHVSQWAAHADDYSPSLKRIQLWAHLIGVPFDLIHRQGLSHIAGQIGEPKETDDWTLNLTSISVAHVKVEVDASLPLPSVIEVGRQNGSFVEVSVEYPWVPPICSHCKEIGHILRNCPMLPPPPKNVTPPAAGKSASKKDPKSVCYSCKQAGHLMRNCPKGPQEWTQVRQKHPSSKTPSPLEQQPESSPAESTPASADTSVNPVATDMAIDVAGEASTSTEPLTAAETTSAAEPIAVPSSGIPTVDLPSIPPIQEGDSAMEESSPVGKLDCVLALSAPFVDRPIIPHPPHPPEKSQPSSSITAANPFTLPPASLPPKNPSKSPSSPKHFSIITNSNPFAPLLFDLESSSTPSPVAVSSPSQGKAHTPPLIMCTKAFFWNVRGFNDPDKHRPFAQWLASHQPIVGAILESHIKEPNLNPILQRVYHGWSFSSNHDTDPDGRIILLWKFPATLHIVHQSSQSITCNVSVPGASDFFFTAVYAFNGREERKPLWEDLREVQTTHFLENRCWIIGGDMNQILHHSEHSSPSIDHLTPDMLEFSDNLLELGLMDLRFQGSSHTWTNKSPTGPTTKKLDRTLVNETWLDSFPDSSATFLPYEFSDHTPCLINLSTPLPYTGTRPFKFLNLLTNHPLFLESIETAWILCGSRAVDLHVLAFKLKQIKRAIKTLNKERFSDIQKRVRITNDLLKVLQVKSLKEPTTENFEAEQMLHHKWTFLRGIEEAFFKQKSRINWLQLGDQNTLFFMKVAAAHYSYNAIMSLLLPNGDLITDPNQICQIAVDHFMKLLAPTVLPQLSSSILWFQQLTTFRCSQQQRDSMALHPTGAEISTMLLKINPNKSPGPDGAAAITDYRPISCCNTTYKAISKILVKKLKAILSEVILPNQTAFVKGRLLIENTLLASEIVQGYHRNGGPKRITIKVDIAKAFDTIRWEFIFQCMRGLELPELFIRWVQACVCTTSFSVGFNGSLHGYFKGKRGLRQGDPLSPYLFVLAMNCLSLSLNRAAVQGHLKYHPKCARTGLTHLCFADDLLIFCDGNVESVECVLQILQDFENRSGLGISLQKTSIFTAGLKPHEVERIKKATGLTSGTLPVRYLGVPLCTKKLSLINCAPLLQAIKSRFLSWTVRSLSFAGRLQLISTVISGLINFWTSAYIIPKACLAEIDFLCSKFLWKGKLDGNGAAKVAWEKVSTPKKEGGLGLKNWVIWNRAYAMKLIWILFFKTDSIWASWYTTEVLDGDINNFWVINTKQKYSWFANHLLLLRDTMYQWIKLRVGNGETCYYWSSNWSPYGNIRNYLQGEGSRQSGVPNTTTLAELWELGSWNLPPARSERQVNVQTFLSTLVLTDLRDEYEWIPNGKRSLTYSARNTYDFLRSAAPTVSWHQQVWFSGGIPKHKFLAWLFVLDRCPTKDRMATWGLGVDGNCVLCNSGQESRDHLFFNCRYSYCIWRDLLSGSPISTPPCQWNDALQALKSRTYTREWRLLLHLVWQATIYFTWSERNTRIHRSNFRSATSISKEIDLLIRRKIAAIRGADPAFSSALFQTWVA
ncbi:Uncharacterized protein Rs2_38309 [Raphanus sativus]|nr:Uncharacterized protein Rs2_38309 [Raphanus sativus]